MDIKPIEHEVIQFERPKTVKGQLQTEASLVKLNVDEDLKPANYTPSSEEEFLALYKRCDERTRVLTFSGLSAKGKSYAITIPQTKSVKLSFAEFVRLHAIFERNVLPPVSWPVGAQYVIGQVKPDLLVHTEAVEEELNLGLGEYLSFVLSCYDIVVVSCVTTTRACDTYWTDGEPLLVGGNINVAENPAEAPIIKGKTPVILYNKYLDSDEKVRKSKELAPLFRKSLNKCVKPGQAIALWVLMDKIVNLEPKLEFYKNNTFFRNCVKVHTDDYFVCDRYDRITNNKTPVVVRWPGPEVCSKSDFPLWVDKNITNYDVSNISPKDFKNKNSLRFAGYTFSTFEEKEKTVYTIINLVDEMIPNYCRAFAPEVYRQLYYVNPELAKFKTVFLSRALAVSGRYTVANRLLQMPEALDNPYLLQMWTRTESGDYTTRFMAKMITRRDKHCVDLEGGAILYNRNRHSTVKIVNVLTAP